MDGRGKPGHDGWKRDGGGRSGADDAGGGGAGGGRGGGGGGPPGGGPPPRRGGPRPRGAGLPPPRAPAPPVGALSALNRTPLAPAWKVPVVLAAGRDEAALQAAATAGNPVTVRLEGRTVPGRGENVVGRKAGRGKAVVVSTPKSGWFHCAGERGSGIAIWLGLARWLATTELNVVLLGASGHEF